jgi:hypothetical protein
MSRDGFRRWLGNLTVLLVTLLLIVAADRAILSLVGRTIWEWDPVLHYRHRPDATRVWQNVSTVRMTREHTITRDGVPFPLEPGLEYTLSTARADRLVGDSVAVRVEVAGEGRRIRINSHGHHDDEFPRLKPAGELRGLVVGNSLPMGHLVTAGETFPNRLEALLEESELAYPSYQVVNAGVQGYSTYQYREVVNRSLDLEPDFLVITFDMNDVTDPYRVNRELGGTGLDYHGVLQTSRGWSAWLLHETGVGRLALRLLGRVNQAELRQRGQEYSVQRMVEGDPADSVLAEAWRWVLDDLAGMYETARENGIPVTLLIGPRCFQLGHPEQQGPQRKLIEHAEAQGVPVLDLTQVIEGWLSDGVVTLADVFLDRDHYTVYGHERVAGALFEHLVNEGTIRPAPTPGSGTDPGR